MPILGSIIKGAINIRSRIPTLQSTYSQQLKQLKKLIEKSQDTSFGQEFNFSDMVLMSDPIETFQKNVPIYDYQSIFDAWWHRALKGEKDVCWPGKTKYFALSSGTSESSSKHIPVTKDFIKTV
jgi:hypothetical protein